jgi:SAM-dependent methyltransferase
VKKLRRRLRNDGVNNDNTINVSYIAMREADHDLLSLLTVEQSKLMEMFYRLECSVSNAHYKDVTGKNWNYVPYSHLRFYKALKELVEAKNDSNPVKDVKFLELGCGLGTKLYIASQWVGCGKVDGIEINPTYAEIARNMVAKRGTVHCMNVKEFKQYGDYDIIYTYGEVREDNNHTINLVKEAMKPGAILLQSFISASICQWIKGEEKVTFDIREDQPDPFMQGE